ncbi:MAG: ATP-binding cassette domain-containing protein [Gammaproteobacteria bacterium]|nr:ATP-binding cassette domain-containing protein [Gammaproteobacteria bacterium]
MSTLLELADLQMLFPISSDAGVTWPFSRGSSYLHAVDGVDLRIEEGDSVGLVGESGCGKSTLVRLIARLLAPSAGRICFQGADLAAVSLRDFSTSAQRAMIQVVFQDSDGSLNPRFKAFDCIAEPIRRMGQPTDRSKLAARVEELAELVGLPSSLLARFPHQLSGGQKARVNIARAIALSPKLLILDEPTSALDVSVQAVILKLLADLRPRLGMTYLFVSHDLNVVRLLCDSVVVMYLGKVVESGPAKRVLRDPRHPYTRTLLAAVPGQTRFAVDKGGFAGEPTSPIDPDQNACRFVGRCVHAQARCSTSAPTLRGDAHQVACHLKLD